METYCFLIDMGKKKKDKSSLADYYLGSGKIGDMLDRYGVQGAKSVRPEQRGVGGHEQRDQKTVDKELAEAMMNDYDTRRSMEAAAMAGEKDAKKFAKKGFKSGNIYEAYDVMRDLKKEYVGGGGMRGAKNEAGLTYALVNADRENMLASLDEKYGQKEEPSKDPADDIGKKAEVVLSDHLKRAKTIVDDWEQNDQQVYADNSGALTQSTGIKETEPPSDQPEPSDIPVGELDLTDPDTFYKHKMNTYSKAFNLTADF